jgi:UTP--glucose-1-phosphate uridylyltransferase
LINDKEKFIAHNFTGKYLDCGTMDGYINSSKEIAKL